MIKAVVADRWRCSQAGLENVQGHDLLGAVFVAVPEVLWRDVLCLQEERRVCLQEERRVGNDCVRWQPQPPDPADPAAPHLMRATVRVHDCPDGTLALFTGPQRLASFPPACAEELAA